jgi:uncharacterized Zn-finger protein
MFNVILKILESDEFTKNICSSCIDSFQKAHQLQTTCIESDKWFRTKREVLNVSLDVAVEVDEKILQTNDVKDKILETLILNELELPQLLPNFPSNLKDDENDEVQSDQIEEIDDNSLSQNEDNDVKSELSKPKRSRRKNLEKTHMCTVCGKTFFTSGHLRSHELTHKDSKDFTCNSCGKKFLMKSYLNRHMKSHLNERSYKCKVCQKGFNTSTTLGYHFRLVHSGTKLTCKDIV